MTSISYITCLARSRKIFAYLIPTYKCTYVFCKADNFANILHLIIQDVKSLKLSIKNEKCHLLFCCLMART